MFHSELFTRPKIEHPGHYVFLRIVLAELPRTSAFYYYILDNDR